MLAGVQCHCFLWRCLCALLLLIKLCPCFLSELILFLVVGLLNIVSCTVVGICEAPWARGKAPYKCPNYYNISIAYKNVSTHRRCKTNGRNILWNQPYTLSFTQLERIILACSVYFTKRINYSLSKCATVTPETLPLFWAAGKCTRKSHFWTYIYTVGPHISVVATQCSCNLVVVSPGARPASCAIMTAGDV